jgi:hypothetical protein
MDIERLLSVTKKLGKIKFKITLNAKGKCFKNRLKY